MVTTTTHKTFMILEQGVCVPVNDIWQYSQHLCLSKVSEYFPDLAVYMWVEHCVDYFPFPYLKKRIFRTDA